MTYDLFFLASQSTLESEEVATAYLALCHGETAECAPFGEMAEFLARVDAAYPTSQPEHPNFVWGATPHLVAGDRALLAFSRIRRRDAPERISTLAKALHIVIYDPESGTIS